jgi:hypothetical protein
MTRNLAAPTPLTVAPLLAAQQRQLLDRLAAEQLALAPTFAEAQRLSIERRWPSR